MKKSLNPVASWAVLALLALHLAPSAARAQTPVAAASAPVLKPVYNEQADARADLNQALSVANAQHKNVLVVFGANWCGDCRALDRKMSEGQLAAHVTKRLLVLKVDVGRFNRNTDLAAQMGVSLKKGIPAVAVLKSDGEVLRASNGGELADARNMGDEAVLKVLEGLHGKP
ncbi:thioredoxin-like negative regulator of GroEL [Paucibacter oligotrophus]|uniref:Thioredoxin-like negative regulator of GroEL n=1 Tax=Roseateles oligotrophus TaxID=1769250 RepID=A0A840LCS4_9BURK|nr:thioredoxin family protein [Roseateles oligotrophus]MBB4845960.1 thioredoxin-like negative regulator of GroEL [Roseateles oligotrophus]